MLKINPYNPLKVLCHYDKWVQTKDWYNHINRNGEKLNDKIVLPNPVTVSVDLANKCNMKCIDCNADFLLRKNKQTMLDKEYLHRLIQALEYWGSPGVCLGGGGDSTLNPHLGYFVEGLDWRGIKSGMVSNGILLHKFPELQLLKWLGISMDAGSAKIWQRVHGMNSTRLFNRVRRNMEDLINKGVDVTYKYLVRPENVGDVYNAIKTAVSIGCKNFHIRPMASPWFNKPNRQLFTEHDLEVVSVLLGSARRDYGNEINIIGVFDKLGDTWQVEHPFKTCWAIFASCVFLSNRKVGLCCDLRGCSTVESGPYDDPIDFVKNFWGSRKHFDIQKKINLKKCSRCTFSIFNQLFEQTIIEDGFYVDFI